MMYMLYVIVLLLNACVILVSARLYGLAPYQNCGNNCSTVVSSPGNYQQLIQCNVKENQCMAELSDPNNPSAPKNKTEGKGWYFYQDRNNETKISLNVSWGPQHDASINFLLGYKVSILFNMDTFSLPCEFYYCFDRTLNQSHKWATFSYNCEQPAIVWNPLCEDLNNVAPGNKYTIQINSLPLSELNSDDIRLDIDLSIPECNDRQMQSLPQCARPKLSIQSVICSAKSVNFSYNIPPTYKISWMKVCIPGEPPINTCKKQIVKLSQSTLVDVVVVSVPDHKFSTKMNYSIVISVMKGYQSSIMFKHFNFQNCQEENPPAKIGSMIPIIIISTVVAVAFVIVCVLVSYKYRDISSQVKRYCCYFDNSDQSEPENLSPECIKQREILLYTIPIDHESPLKIPFKPSVLSAPVIYIVFVDDFPQHRDVILKFSAFLRHDLGFEVLCELFEKNVIYSDYCTWMENCMLKADKIIVVWSEGAVNRWNQCEDPTDSPSLDLFTPVLKKIKKDLFCDKNLRKYYFTYFEYFEESKIPKAFQSLACCHFRLMKQFEELYFQLKDMEMYSSQQVLREEKVAFDTYFEPDVNKYGPALLKSITEMCIYAKHNPNWFNDEHGNEVALGGHSAPPPLDMSYIEPIDLLENKLSIIPPLPIQTSSNECTYPPNAPSFAPEDHKVALPVDAGYMSNKHDPITNYECHKNKENNFHIKTSRAPCENEDSDFSSFQLENELFTVESGYSTNSPVFFTPSSGGLPSLPSSPGIIKTDSHSPPTSFNFSDDENDFPVPVGKLCPAFVPRLVAIDMHNDPQISLSIINNF